MYLILTIKIIGISLLRIAYSLRRAQLMIRKVKALSSAANVVTAEIAALMWQQKWRREIGEYGTI